MLQAFGAASASSKRPPQDHLGQPGQAACYKWRSIRLRPVDHAPSGRDSELSGSTLEHCVRMDLACSRQVYSFLQVLTALPCYRQGPRLSLGKVIKVLAQSSLTSAIGWALKSFSRVLREWRYPVSPATLSATRGRSRTLSGCCEASVRLPFQLLLRVHWKAVPSRAY